MRKFFLPLVVFFVFSCDSDQDKAGRFFIKGNDALNNGQYEQAIRFYSEALAIVPKYKEALNNRGVAYYQDGRYTEAIIDYSNILVQIDMGYADALRNRANAYIADGKYDKALSDLASLEEQFPDSAYVHFTKGIAFHESKEYPKAVEAFEKSFALDSNDAEALVNAANSYFYMKQFDKANELLNRAEAIDATEPNIYNTKGLIAMEVGDLDEAHEWFNQALKMDPGNPYYHNNRGFLNLEIDNLDEAAEDIRRAIIGAPQNGWAYRNRGILFLKRERYEDAIRNFEMAFKLDEQIPFLYYYWARTLAVQGLNAEACEKVSSESETADDIESFKRQVCR